MYVFYMLAKYLLTLYDALNFLNPPQMLSGS